MTDDDYTHSLEAKLGTIEHHTIASRDDVRRWIRVVHSSIIRSDVDAENIYHMRPEITVYEWRSGEELGGADRAQIGAFRLSERYVHFTLHPEAFAEFWSAKETSDQSYGLRLGLKEIDPDVYAVTQAVLIASKPPPKADQLHPVVAEMRDMSKAFYKSLILGAFYVFVALVAVNWLPKLFDWAFGFGRSKGLW